MTVAADTSRAQRGARTITRPPLGAAGTRLPLRDRGLLHALEELAGPGGDVEGVTQVALARYVGSTLRSVQNGLMALDRGGFIVRPQVPVGATMRVKLRYPPA